MHDTIPNFAGQPSIRSLKSGPWSSASTWNLGRVPTASDIVSIAGGTTVTIDSTSSVAAVIGIEALGKLAFRPDIATRLTVGTLQVLPQGTLEVGTAATPINAAVTAEIRIVDRPLDLTNDGIGVFDPRQFGTGLVSVDGTVTMYGSVKTPYQRLAIEPKRGDLTLTLAAPVSAWRAGDRIFLPDSKPVSSGSPTYTYEGEEMTVSSVSANGLTVYLAAALLYGHPGGRDGNDVLEFLPHVGNLTRNILIQSANPAGTRGHMFFTERSTVDVRNVQAHNLGRTTIDPLDSTTFDSAGNVIHMGTNHIGRYPMHFHHVLGPVTLPASGHQFTLQGNVVDDDATINRHKWAMTIHASHYGQIDQNVVYNAGGWGIGTEDGSESFNEFTGNFVAKVRGEGGRESSEAGDGMWFRGPNNYVRDNVIANVKGDQLEGSHGMQLYFKYLGNICVPNFPGADMGQCTTKNGNQLPLLEFARNEVYGATEIGLTIWWLGTSDYTPLAVAPSTVKDFRVWNFTLYGYYGYTANQLTFDGYVARGRKAFLSNVNEFVTGIWFGDYMNQDVVIRHADIQNLRIGIIAPYFMRGSTLIEDSYLRNAVNIRVNTIGAPGSQPMGANMPAKQTTIKNVTFAAVNGSVSTWGPYDIDMNYTLWNGSSNLVKRDAVYVTGFNKVAGDDFQVFYNEQDPNFIVPQSSGNLAGSPAAGLTNAQNWATYGIAIAGEVATNTTTRTGIKGLVRGGSAPPPSQPQPTAPSITAQPTSVSVATGAAATFGVTATGTSLTYQWQKNNANISGATSATYTTPAAAASDNGSTFRCIVTNTAGSVTSNAATLTVSTSASAPSITKQPASVSVAAGATATFTAAASGSPAPTVQWQVSTNAGATFSNVTGATSATYAFAAAAADNNKRFRVIFTNSAGTVTSGAATLTVAVPTTITKQPSNAAVASGAKATFSVTATGGGTLTYQWQKNNVNISGATSASYTTPAAATGDNGSTYRCIVQGSGGAATSSAATLTVSSSAGQSSANKSPMVNAGVDKTVTFKSPSVSITLTGTVTDDGLPNAKPTIWWTMVNGPAAVSFGTSSSVTTTVKFTKAGDYTLALYASDGAYTVADTVVVHVK